jgi:hypothetical protein
VRQLAASKDMNTEAEEVTVLDAITGDILRRLHTCCSELQSV